MRKAFAMSLNGQRETEGISGVIMMRLFTGIPLGADFKNSIVSIYHRFSGFEGLRFTATENLHVTLKFFGEAQPEMVDGLKAALDRACGGTKPFFISSAGVSCFGSEKYARVIWCNIEKNSGKISELFARIEEESAAAGFKKEERAFTPHITIARSKEGVNIKRRLKDIKFDYGAEAGGICLFSSTLSPQGPKYDIIHRVIFKE